MENSRAISSSLQQRALAYDTSLTAVFIDSLRAFKQVSVHVIAENLMNNSPREMERCESDCVQARNAYGV